MEKVLAGCVRHLERMDLSRLRGLYGSTADNTLSENMREIDRLADLEDLTRILHGYHGVALVIMIDDYDAPFETAWKYGYYDNMREFAEQILIGALKDNDHLSFGCLSGVLKIRWGGMLSGPDHLDINVVLDRTYDKFFGFTAEEARDGGVLWGIWRGRRDPRMVRML